MAQNLRILNINTHPHDFTHTAGTMGIHTSTGDHVTLVSVTSGAATHDEKLAEEMMKPAEDRDQAVIESAGAENAARKEEELRKAAALFGITDVRFLGFPDKPFSRDRSPEAVEAIRDVIVDVRPAVLIAQSPYNMGRHGQSSPVREDHAEVGSATIEAVQRAGIPRPDGEPPHRIAATYFAGVHFQRDEVDFVVDISDWFEQRVEAEAMFVSQGHTPEFSRRRVEIGTGGTGWFARTMYGESFVRSSTELVERIIVPEPVLRLAKANAPHLNLVPGRKERVY